MGRPKSFVISYDTLWRGLIKMKFFSDKEKACLADLSHYLSYENAIVGRNGPMSTIEMAKALGMDDSNFRKVLRSLMRKNAIGCFESGERRTYYINPELYCKGDRKPWLEQQFAHRAYVAQQEHMAEIVELHKYRSTLMSPIKENIR